MPAPRPSSPPAEANDGGRAASSLFSIPKMDCPSEERLVRMAMEDGEGIVALEFDLAARELRVVHRGPVGAISMRLERLDLGSRFVSSSPTAVRAEPGESRLAFPTDRGEAQVLWWLLGINTAMFVVEIVIGWLAQSTGLLADSLDMFADASVYGLALYAVGRDAAHESTAARLSGWLQLTLALGALLEVLRRCVFGSEPEPPLMMGTALAALAANVTCLVLLSGHRNAGVHMKASWIFSTNDVLANLGVIVAGGLVAWSGSNYPDLVIGALIGLLVLNGARRILRLQG
jgi:hypothetical protein